MANAAYPSFKALLLGGDFDADTASIKAVLVDTGVYTYSSAHDYLADIAEAARIATSAALTNVTKTSGQLNADDPTITYVSGNSVEAVVLYKDTGDAATSPLLVYLDTGVTGLPLTPNGGDVTLTWGAYIFSL